MGHAAPEAERRIAAAFDAPTAIEGLFRLRERLDAPRDLRTYGMPEDGIATATEAALAAVPRQQPTDRHPRGHTGLLRAAREGADPR